MDAGEARLIGERLRMIRRRRGIGLAVAAGLAGISKQYLSLLERGERGFNRRGLLEDLAEAIGCSVTDLTGQPYHLPDRDGEAIRHLDAADRLAPQRIRMEPMARELVLTLSRRAPRRIWELDSLRNRFGIGPVS